ncbi:unnamed protein product, partial [Prorocentrum cordatum]
RRWRRRRRGRRRRRRGRWRRRRRRGSSRRRRRRCAAGTLAVVRCFSPRCPVWGGPAGAALGCPRGPAPRQSRLERGGQGGPGQARQPRAAKKKKLTAEGLPQCVWPCGCCRGARPARAEAAKSCFLGWRVRGGPRPPSGPRGAPASIASPLAGELGHCRWGGPPKAARTACAGQRCSWAELTQNSMQETTRLHDRDCQQSTGWGPRWRTLRRLAYACAAPCSSLAARATLPGPRAAPGGPGTGGAGPAARARCGASAGVRSSLGGCTEKHPLCPDGRRPGRDIGSGAASRRPTAWWGPRRRQRWPYSVLTSSPPDLQAKQGCPENPDRRGDSGDREGAAQTARAARELSRAERGDPAKQRQASPVGSRLGSQPAGKGSGPSWSGDRLESLCGPQH